MTLTREQVAAAIRQEIADRLGASLEDCQLIDSSLAARMLDVRLADLPALLPRIHVESPGQKARYRYRLSDIRRFIESRTLSPTTNKK